MSATSAWGLASSTKAAAPGGAAITTNGDTTNDIQPVEYVTYSLVFPDAGATNNYHLYVRYRLLTDQNVDDSAWALNPLDSDPTQAASWDKINNTNAHAPDTTYHWIDLASNVTPGLDLIAAYTNVLSGLHGFAFGGRENGFLADSFVFSTGFNLDTTAYGQQLLTAAVTGPTLTPSGGSAAFVENGAAVAVDGGLTVADPDDANLTSATVTISANYVAGQDLLNFTNQNGITGNWNVATGVLSLSGMATLAQYEAAFRSITYSNTSDTPSTSLRTVSFIASDGDMTSAAVARNVTVAAGNDAPVNSVPGAQSVAEDSTLVFSTATQ